MNIVRLLRKYYNKIIQSIAFFPAILSIAFLLLSWIMLEIDFSEFGQHLKSGVGWLELSDASTARTILATVAGAIISLTVFSFSMVMIVLNQAASQMTNRVLTSIIENRFQQTVLGFYIGTTVYALFLLSTIREGSDSLSIPSLSIFLLILLTIVNIFLFIYFLDYVTQTVKYETVIKRVQTRTFYSMKEKFKTHEHSAINWDSLPFTDIYSPESGYFQSFNEQQLLKIAENNESYIRFTCSRGSYLVKGVPFIRVYGQVGIDKNKSEQILASIDIFNGQPIDRNPNYGFRQITEIAIKSLSPGINDPGTAVICLHALTDLFAYHLYQNFPSVIRDGNEKERLYIPAPSFIDLFNSCIPPIWNYGKNDQFIQQEVRQMLLLLKKIDGKHQYTEIFDKWIAIVAGQSESTI